MDWQPDGLQARHDRDLDRASRTRPTLLSFPSHTVAPGMSFRDSWLPNIVVTLINDVLMLAVPIALWIARHWSSMRAIWIRLCQFVRARFPVHRKVVPVTFTLVLPEFPAGTAAAIATAMQTQPLPRYVNNTQSTFWEAAEHENRMAALFAMQSTMRGFPATIVSQRIMTDEELAFPAAQ